MTSPVTPGPDAALHEIRTEWRAGRSLGRVYRTPSGGLEARLFAEGASLHRIYGPSIPDVTLAWEDLDALARAFASWVDVRDDWAAYYEKGVVGSSAAAQVYWPAGRAAERRTLGFRHPFPGARPGVVFTGVDELRPLARPHLVAVGIEAIAELWRAEPAVGPREGERVGERWLVGGCAIVELRRLEARSIGGGGRFTWLGHEAGVPAELVALRPRIAGDVGG